MRKIACFYGSASLAFHAVKAETALFVRSFVFVPLAWVMNICSNAHKKQSRP